MERTSVYGRAVRTRSRKQDLTTSPATRIFRNNLTMLGLQRQQQHQGNENEPPEVRGLSKHQLYNQLAEQYLLPAYDSKGVNRTYLVGVFSNNYLRIPLMEWKRFEINLTPNQIKRNNLVNLSYMLRKVNGILRERGMNPLGFPDFIIPEESWLVNVARFIDRKNVMEFFSVELTPLGQPESESERVHQGRVFAFEFLFQGNQLMQNPKVFGSLKEISECYRRIISKRVDLEEIEALRTSMQQKLVEEEGLLKSALMKASTTIVAIAHQGFDPDEIYLGEDQVANDHRHQLGEIVQL